MGGEVRERTHTIATLGRLADQFRRDVHGIQGEPSLAADHRSAEFRLGAGRTVQWRVGDGGEIVRVEHAHGTADREDQFVLPQGSTATMEIRSQSGRKFVALRIDSAAFGGPSLAIEAIAGRDAEEVRL